MVEACPLTAWKLNSIIIHATASSATGPYRYRDEVMTHFAHNPHIQLVPTADPPLFVLYHIGCGAGGPTMNCTGMPVPIPPGKIPNHVNRYPCDSSGYIGMLVSESPNGPWRNASGPLLVRSDGVVEPQQGLTNPALCVPSILTAIRPKSAPPVLRLPANAPSDAHPLLGPRLCRAAI